jgi:hypothetical protein
MINKKTQVQMHKRSTIIVISEQSSLRESPQLRYHFTKYCADDSTETTSEIN